MHKGEVLYKNNYTITLNPFLTIFIFSSLLFFNPLYASQQAPTESTITLPIEVNLNVLENYLNEFVPNILADIDEPNKVCVKPQYLKTKGIPKCRMDGYKISCKENKIKIRTIPEIKCDLRGWVKRDGHISVSGQGRTLQFTFPIKTKLSTDLYIQGSANAAAIIYIYATPHINKDWSISVDVEPYFTWSEKPTLTLLETIEVTIQSKVEPKLQKKIRQFVKKIPDLLTKLELKEKVNTTWHDIQRPIKIDDHSETYLMFKPEYISYSGFKISDNILKTTISAKGETHIIVGNPIRKCQNTKLCELGIIPSQKGEFNFNLPISITYQELLTMSNKNFLEGYSIDLLKSALPGMLKISDPKIEKSDNGQLSITAHINYDNRSYWLKTIDFFNWFDVDGEITFKGLPRVDKHNRCLVLDDLVYDSTTNSDLFDTVVNAADIQLLKSYFTNLMKFEFGEKIDDGIIKANKALKSFSKGNINISAQLQMASIENLIVNEHKITINTKLSGLVNANIGL